MVVFVQFPSLLITIEDTVIDGTSYSNVIPISYKEDFHNALKVNDQKYYRWQLPLLPAGALNTHKVQGITATNGVVIKPTAVGKDPYARGLEYVALSRCKTICDHNLILLTILTKQHFVGNAGTRKQMILINNAYDKFRKSTSN